MKEEIEDFNNLLKELAKETQVYLSLTAEPTDGELREILSKLDSKKVYDLFKISCKNQKKVTNSPR